eukprot:3188168-Pyramimonas_sp.AAC.1
MRSIAYPGIALRTISSRRSGLQAFVWHDSCIALCCVLPWGFQSARGPWLAQLRCWCGLAPS